MVMENGKKVLYVVLQKALYGTLQAALLFWENVSAFLVNELGFKRNPYDSCMVNKMINGKQCTIIWHVDDFKLSHLEQSILDSITEQLNECYGWETPLTIHHGKVHDYLGMVIDYSEEGKVKFSMPNYIEGLLDEAPDDMNGESVTPAANNLFTMCTNVESLNNEDAKMYHHLTAKLLYLSK